MKISCVMTTWRRMTCVERAIACFLAQDWPGEIELIIYNTDVEHMLEPSIDLINRLNERNRLALCVNNEIDRETGRPYTNTGAIRRDALRYASGTHYICWDDDDLYFPWDVRQRVDGLMRSAPVMAWKPYLSWFHQRGLEPTLMFNYLEASVLVEIDAVRELGFKRLSGAEHLSWFESLSENGLLKADHDAIPGYAFNWADPIAIAGHKQSGYGAQPMPTDNFERHKAGCTDIARGPLMTRRFPQDYPEVCDAFLGPMLALSHSQRSLYEKYVVPHLTSFATEGVTS